MMREGECLGAHEGADGGMQADPTAPHRLTTRLARRVLRVAALLLAASMLCAPRATAAEDAAAAPAAEASRPREETVAEAVCRLIEPAARKEGLPIAFFTRLIWRESSFRKTVVSRAGAQGIAQFMPGTAKERGLADPFDPEAAIPASANFLAELKAQFGNLGLAAAAYNAGPGRVKNWLDGKASLPAETVAYVRFVTRRPADAWAALSRGEPAGEAPEAEPEDCLKVTVLLRVPVRTDDGEVGIALAPLSPWGVQVAGNFSKAIALRSWERVRVAQAQVIGEARPMIIGTRLAGRGRRAFYRVRLPAETRADAESLCTRLRQASGSCIVLKN
jgi:hypothetical protein